MTRFPLTTAALTFVAGAALADTHTDHPEAASPETRMVDYSNLVRAEDIMDGTIYSISPTADTAWEADTAFDAVDVDWNDIGEIEDVVLDRSGQLVGVVGEVGGFLDIGDKHVFLPVQDVRLVPAEGGEYAYVTRYSEEQLAAIEEVDEDWWD